MSRGPVLHMRKLVYYDLIWLWTCDWRSISSASLSNIALGKSLTLMGRWMNTAQDFRTNLRGSSMAMCPGFWEHWPMYQVDAHSDLPLPCILSRPSTMVAEPADLECTAWQCSLSIIRRLIPAPTVKFSIPAILLPLALDVVAVLITWW